MLEFDHYRVFNQYSLIVSAYKLYTKIKEIKYKLNTILFPPKYRDKLLNK